MPCGAVDQRGDRRVRHHPLRGAAGQHAGLSVQVQDHGGRPAGLGDGAQRGVRPRQAANDREPAGDREARQDREEQGGRGPPEGEGCQPGRRDRDPTQQQRSQVGRRELDRPDRRGHGNEAQVHPHPATRASRILRHRTGRAHTVTSSTSSRGDRRTDAGHVVELVDAAEGALRRAVVDDPPRQHRSDARQRVEIGGRGGVEVHPLPGARSPRAGAARRILRTAGRTRGGTGHADGYLFTVGDDGGQVQGRGIGLRQEPTGSLDGIGHPRARREGDQSGAAHQAHDGHHDRRRRLGDLADRRRRGFRRGGRRRPRRVPCRDARGVRRHGLDPRTVEPCPAHQQEGGDQPGQPERSGTEVARVPPRCRPR